MRRTQTRIGTGAEPAPLQQHAALLADLHRSSATAVVDHWQASSRSSVRAPARAVAVAAFQLRHATNELADSRWPKWLNS